MPNGARSGANGLRLLAVIAILSLSSTGFVMLFAAETPDAAVGLEAFDSVSSDFLQPAAGTDQTPGRIKYLSQDGPMSLANGGVVPLAADLQVAVTVSPYPPTSFDLDLDLYLTTTEGEPVLDADIASVWDMTVMWHGPFDTPFTNLGDGHYVAPFHFFMFGPWQMVNRIAVPGHDPIDDLAISIYTWPE